MKVCIALFLMIAFSFPAYAFKYSENDKQMFYDAFLDGYYTEMQKSIDKLDIEQEKKDKFMAALKKNTNKQELINLSWDCIKTYSIKQIISAAVICTQDWNKVQRARNKDLFEMLK